MDASPPPLQVTSDKLEEWRDIIPRAGPKYRLGMYFDTIHEIPEFDAVANPDGYQSHWETDTDLQTDDEFGSFIFSKVDGDSASVVCVDDEEAIDLIQQFNLRRRQRPSACVGDITSTNRKEVMYDNLDGEDDEHVYESIEDCIDEYQLFVCNKEGSPPNNDTPTHTKVTQKIKPYKAKRSYSLPSSQPDASSLKHMRKYSDCSEYAKLSRRHHERRDYCSYPPPLPPPNQPSPPNEQTLTYTQLFRLPSSTTNKDTRKQSPTHHQQVVLKHKGREHVLPLTDTKPSRRHSSSSTSPKHNNHIQCSLSTPSHLSNLYTSISRRSPPRSESKEVAVIKRKPKHSTSYSSNLSSTPGSTCSTKPHVTLYGVL